MAVSKPETIKIVEEQDDGNTIYQLYIDGGRRAVLTQTKEDKLYFELQFSGEFHWDEARVFVQGIIKLAEVGDKLAGKATDVKRLLHEPTDEEIDMATKKAAAKAAKKAAKGVKREPGAKRESAAQLFQDLIMEGKKTDDQIFAQVKAKYKLSDDKRRYVAWYRNKLTKDGKKPPAAKE